jgi:hypothetical protein
MRRAARDRPDPQPCEAENPQPELLSRPRAASPLEASRPGHRPEPETGQGQAARVPGQARRRPPLIARKT